MKIKQPILLIDEEKAKRNIARISLKASIKQTEVWPHFKTHQSYEVGDWFKDAKIHGITVSSVSMANYFAKGGWTSIYVAFPLNINQIEDIAELASAIDLTVLVNDVAQVNKLIENVSSAVKVKIEIETGGKRSGVLPEAINLISELLDKISASQHSFDGFYSHFGHTYRASNRAEVMTIFDEAFNHLVSLKKVFSAYEPKISLGDTPSASVMKDYEDIHSVHAGNYVFYDLTQSQIGVCDEEDIAVALATPIVSKNKESLELVVYGGGIHLSKEQMFSREFDKNIYGKPVELGADKWSDSLKDCYVRSISQEHGVISVTKEVFDRFNIGDALGILPVHSCMTADCMGQYYTFDGRKIDHFQGQK